MSLADLIMPSDGYEPITDILNRKEAQYERTASSVSDRNWLPVHLVEEDMPVGCQFFGDIHIDDDGCNIPLLLKHLKLCADTEGLAAVHVGDIINNWHNAGSLARLHSKQSTRVVDGYRLAEHLLVDSGVDWWLWTHGNHDLWGDAKYVLESMHKKAEAMYMEEWDARLEIFSGDKSWRVHVAHDFRGQSMWNTTHGPSRAAQMGGGADLYVCGHKHTWGIQQFETGNIDRPVAHIARARGYKEFDEYAKHNGFSQDMYAASITAIFDPTVAEGPGQITLHADPILAAQDLTRRRRDAKKVKK